MNKKSYITVGQRTGSSATGWKALNPYTIEFSQNKNIVVFGGNTTTNPQAANGNAKIPEALISSGDRQKTNIYSFGYVAEPFRSEHSYISKEFEAEIRDIYHASFEPLLFDKYSYIKKEKGIEQTFQNLVIVAHCGGSVFANIIIEEFKNTLLKYYPPKIVENAISKIQYFAYAPNEMPRENVSSFIITPLFDPNHSWNNALAFSRECGVNNDFPKGSIKKLLKSQNQGKIAQGFQDAFTETRGITFRIGNLTFLIPAQLNDDKNVGDHSIACLTSKRVSDPTDCGQNTKLANAVAKKFFKHCMASGPIDVKNFFSQVSSTFDENPPSSQRGSY